MDLSIVTKTSIYSKKSNLSKIKCKVDTGLTMKNVEFLTDH